MRGIKKNVACVLLRYFLFNFAEYLVTLSYKPS